jgi:heme exporter protein C
MVKIAKYILGLAMAWCTWAAFYYLPPAGGGTDGGFADPELARMLAFHLPNAMAAVWAAIAGAVFAWRYLQKRDPMDDIKSHTAAILAMLFCVLTTATGMVFAQVQWGEPWNWDPKQTGMFLLLLLYAAYFVLRGSISDPEKRGTISAVYLVFTAAMTPMLGYVIPKYLQSLHPKDVVIGGLDSHYKLVTYSLAACFIGLYAWLHSLGVRTARLQRVVADED